MKQYVRSAAGRIFLCSVFLAFFCLLCASFRQSTDIRTELSQKLLRFRVLANSDTPADQLQKNKVSAGLSSCLAPFLSSCESKEEAIKYLKKELPAIQETAAKLAAYYGEDYPVSCTLGIHQFPVKLYDGLTFPAGTYDTLLVTIGDGAGSNWWCLAYPPLCFAEEAYVTVPEQTKHTLQEILSPQAFTAISGKSQTQKQNGTKEYKETEASGTPAFCFRLFPFLNRFFQ